MPERAALLRFRSHAPRKSAAWPIGLEQRLVGRSRNVFPVLFRCRSSNIVLLTRAQIRFIKISSFGGDQAPPLIALTSAAAALMKLASLMFSVLILTSYGVATAAPFYQVTEIPTLGGIINAAGVNDSGEVVGQLITASGTPEFYAFLYSGGTMQDLGALGGTNSEAAGINNSGQIVGDAETTSADHAFLYSGGVMHDLGTLGGLGQ